MGYKSFTELVAQQNMAASPEVVMSFLQNLSQAVKDKAEKVFVHIALSYDGAIDFLFQ